MTARDDLARLLRTCNCSLSDPHKGSGMDPARCVVHGDGAADAVIREWVPDILERIAEDIERELVCCGEPGQGHDFCDAAIFARRPVLAAAQRGQPE